MRLCVGLLDEIEEGCRDITNNGPAIVFNPPRLAQFVNITGLNNGTWAGRFASTEKYVTMEHLVNSVNRVAIAKLVQHVIKMDTACRVANLDGIRFFVTQLPMLSKDSNLIFGMHVYLMKLHILSGERS
ncbi:hypothetical protein DPMN_100608, partial [Dreissena polymorpha]